MKLEDVKFMDEKQWYRVLREERYQYEDDIRKWALKEFEKTNPTQEQQNANIPSHLF